jgi:hypothetical protein
MISLLIAIIDVPITLALTKNLKKLAIEPLAFAYSDA